MIEIEPLVFDLDVTLDTWAIQGPVSARRRVPSPLADVRFRSLVTSLRDWIGQPVPLGRADLLKAAEFVKRRAFQISDRLTEVLFQEEDRQALREALSRAGQSRLVIRARSAGPSWDSATDAALALPWELIAPEEPDVFPVRDGRLHLLREAVAEGSPNLPEPSGPLMLAVLIAAPEDRADFPYEQEAFRLLTALSPLGQHAVFSNLGSLEDLVRLVADVRATAIHFRGHGLPGELLFEDDLGFAREVPVSELKRRLAAVLLDPDRAGAFPGLFFLAAPFTAREPSPEPTDTTLPFEDSSASAAALHRGGFAQVVGYFGPVDQQLSTRLEERFYSALAAGKSTPGAAEEARGALLEPVGSTGKEVHYPFGWCQLAVYHRGPDRALAVSGKDRRLSPRFRNKVIVNGLPVLERGFIGRRDLLHEIRRKLADGQRLLVLQGLGGLGKTALASHLLTHVLEVETEDLLVLRCQEVEDAAADPVLALRAQAEEHGRLYEFPFWEETVRDLRERFPEAAGGFLEVIRVSRQHRPRLVIYADNVESLQLGPKCEDENLGSWKPSTDPWWQVLLQLENESDEPILLSARYLWRDLSTRAWIGVGPMGRADVLRMIDSAPVLAQLQPETRGRIARRVDGHPRTILYLDRLVAQQRRQIGRRPLQDTWRELIEPLLPEETEHITADLLLEEIWQCLSDDSKLHAKRIGVLRIPASLNVIDHLGGARNKLIRAGLLSRYRFRVSTELGMKWFQRWGFQDLVGCFVQMRTSVTESMSSHEAAAQAYQEWLQRGRGAILNDQESAIFHFHTLGRADQAWPLTHKYSLYLRSEARYEEACQVLKSSEAAGLQGDRLAIALTLVGQLRILLGESGASIEELFKRSLRHASSRDSRLSANHTYGHFLLQSGRYDEAENLFRQLMIDGMIDKDEHAYFLYSLADALDRQGSYSQAEDLLRRVLEIRADSPDDGQGELAMAMHALAGVLGRQGRYTEAEELARKSIAIMETDPGKCHPHFGMALHTLGGLLERQGRYPEAEEALRSTILIKAKTLGEDHPSFGESLHALANTIVSQGRPAEAVDLFDRALVVKEKALGGDNLEIAPTLLQLGATLGRLGQNSTACEHLKRALTLLKVSPGQYHPLLGAVLHELATLAVRQGQYSQAEDLLCRAIILKEKSLGESHPDLATSLHTLGIALIAQNRHPEAGAVLQRALGIKQTVLGTDHPSLAISFQELGRVLSACGRLHEAEKLFQQALEIYDKEPEPPYQAMIPLLTNLGGILAALGREKEGEQFVRRALDLAVEVSGRQGLLVAQTLTMLAQLQSTLGKPEAAETAEEAKRLLLEALAPDHPTVGTVLPILQAICGDFPE